MLKVIKDFWLFTDEKFIQFCLKYIKKEDKIIEIGPGDGLFANRLLEKLPYLCYEFVDIKDTKVFQKERYMSVVDISIGKIQKEEGSTDIVIASQVIEHLKNMSNFFGSISNIEKEWLSDS